MGTASIDDAVTHRGDGGRAARPEWVHDSSVAVETDDGEGEDANVECELLDRGRHGAEEGGQVPAL